MVVSAIPVSQGVLFLLQDLHGIVLGIYNWGIYLGYGAAFAIGNQVGEKLSWHWVYSILLASITAFYCQRTKETDQ